MITERKPPHVQLEEEFSKFLNLRDCVVCNSGTSALHMAFESLKLKRGSEVLCPDFSMIACPRAIVMAGLKPVFIDCDRNMNIDSNLFPYILNNNNLKSSKVWCVLVVHTYGRSCNMSAISKFADYYPTAIVEDLSELHGVPPHSDTTSAGWSFYKNKVIGGEEGGACVFTYHNMTPDEQKLVHTELRQMRSHGFTDLHNFWHVPNGYNYRLADSLAKLILESLRNYEYNSDLRRFIERSYNDIIPTVYQLPLRESVWVYDLRIPGMTWEQQDELVSILKSEGIEARHAFKPNHLQSEFKDYSFITKDTGLEPLSVTYSKEVIYLPVDPSKAAYRYEAEREKTWRTIETFLARTGLGCH